MHGIAWSETDTKPSNTTRVSQSRVQWIQGMMKRFFEVGEENCIAMVSGAVPESGPAGPFLPRVSADRSRLVRERMQHEILELCRMTQERQNACPKASAEPHNDQESL
jgi:hypothetical protein